MLGLIQTFFAKPAHPIGIDWDGTTFRLAQVERVGNGFQLRAATQKRWPGQLLRVDDIREAVNESDFAGRDAIFIPPANLVQLFTVDDDQEIANPSNDRITRIWSTGAGRKLVSVADKVAVSRLLQTLADAGLVVSAVALLPSTINDLSRRIFRRSQELSCTALHIHLGESATTCFVAQAGVLHHVEQSEFSRSSINRAVASEMNLSESSADELRQHLLHAAASIDWTFDRTLIHRPAAGQHGHPLAQSTAAEASELCGMAPRLQSIAGQAVRPLIERLAQLRSHYPRPIDRLIFSGSEALDRPLCETIARALQLPAHVADPILRMQNRSSRELAGGIDRRLPQPGWAAAIGASMGVLAMHEVAR